jgi:hypothetical protein
MWGWLCGISQNHAATGVAWVGMFHAWFRVVSNAVRWGTRVEDSNRLHGDPPALLLALGQR